MADDSSHDGMIPLEGISRAVPLDLQAPEGTAAPGESLAEKSATKPQEPAVQRVDVSNPVETAPPSAPAAPTASAETDKRVFTEHPEIDSLIIAEDPDFTATLSELSDLASSGGSDLDDSDLLSIVLDGYAEARLHGLKKLRLYFVEIPVRSVKNFISVSRLRMKLLRQAAWTKSILFSKKLAVGIKDGSIYGLSRTRAGINAFLDLSTTTKAKVLTIGILAVASVMVLKISYTQHFMPGFETKFLRSFADVADAKYTYSEDDPWEDFNNPLLHPEHVVEIERIVANLRHGADGSNPMALIDIYIEVANQEAAVELKDRESEARDVIGRTLEQIPYDELVTVEGKNKFKTVLRRSLNAFLTKGMARKIYFKSIVLKP